jgi:hypothetical protein
MLQSLSGLRGPLERVMKSEVWRELRGVGLTSADFSLMESLLPVLQRLSDASHLLSGDHFASMSRVFPVFITLCRKHLAPSAEDAAVVKDLKVRLAESISRHLEDVMSSGVSLVATLLDPGTARLSFLSGDEKSKYYDGFEKSVVDMFGPSDAPSASYSTSAAVSAAVVSAAPSSSTSAPSGEDRKKTADTSAVCDPELRKFLDVFSVPASDESSAQPSAVSVIRPPRPSLEDRVKGECRAYFHENALPNDWEDPLVWWKRNADVLPLLWSAARKLLACPASSVSCKGVSSDFCDVVGEDEASSLTDDEINMKIFLFLNGKLQSE